MEEEKIKTMTKEELLNKTNHSLRMKDLRKFVENNKDMDDNAPCVVERVEDRYFGEGGWSVLKVEGYHYNSSLEWNNRFDVGEELDFTPAIFSEKELEEMKEQFYQPHCITTDKEIVYICSHY